MIAIFRYIPSLRDEWEGSILWVSPEKFVPQVVGHEKGEKLSLPKIFFEPPSLSKELAGPFLWVLPKRILKSPSSGRSWEGEKYKDQGKFSLVASKLMPCFVSALESGIKIDATP